jgi:hypothetical protein
VVVGKDMIFRIGRTPVEREKVGRRRPGAATEGRKRCELCHMEERGATRRRREASETRGEGKLGNSENFCG